MFEITAEGRRYPAPPEHFIGSLPTMLSVHDPRPAREQFDAAYGWQPYKGWSGMKVDGTLSHPGDPDMRPLALTQFRNETIYVYPHSFVGIVQPDGSFEVARMD